MRIGGLTVITQHLEVGEAEESDRKWDLEKILVRGRNYGCRCWGYTAFLGFVYGIMGKISWEMMCTAQKEKKWGRRAGGEDHRIIGVDGSRALSARGGWEILVHRDKTPLSVSPNDSTLWGGMTDTILQDLE